MSGYIMLQGKSVGRSVVVESDLDPHLPGSCDPGQPDVDYVLTGAAGSDEFSPTASPGSPLDSDDALDDLPPELLCGSAVMLADKSVLHGDVVKDDTSAAGVLLTAADHTQAAKHHSKVFILLSVFLSVCVTGCRCSVIVYISPASENPEITLIFRPTSRL